MYYGYNQEEDKGSFVQWIIRDAGVYQACGPTVPQLPPGAYSCTYDNYGNAIFQSRRLYVDDLITREADRSKGYAGLLIDWLLAEATKRGCAEFHLDSADPGLSCGQVGAERGVVAPFLEEVLVEPEGGFEQLAAEDLEAGDLQELALADRGEVAVDGVPAAQR